MPAETCIDCQHLIFYFIVDGHNVQKAPEGPMGEVRRTSIKTSHMFREDQLPGVKHIAIDFYCRENRWGSGQRLYVDFQNVSTGVVNAPSTFAIADEKQAADFRNMMVETDRSDWGCFIRAQPDRDLEIVVEEAKLAKERKNTETALQAARNANKIQFWLLLVTIIALVIGTIVQVIDLLTK